MGKKEKGRNDLPKYVLYEVGPIGNATCHVPAKDKVERRPVRPRALHVGNLKLDIWGYPEERADEILAAAVTKERREKKPLRDSPLVSRNSLPIWLDRAEVVPANLLGVITL